VSKTQADDLEAVRTVSETLEPFAQEDRERILRWVREKLGMTGNPGALPVSRGPALHVVQPAAIEGSPTRATKDIKTFIGEKSPKSDRQLAAAVAYYYAFEAPLADRKDSIRSQDLIDACRKAGIRRPTNPGQTLRNSAHAGYLDKASEPGSYRLNAVGENLIAMVLPDGGTETAQPKQRKRSTKKRAAQRAGKKKR
jgi:hypothetical protein